MTAEHQLLVHAHVVTAVRERVERVLGVTTTAGPTVYDRRWWVRFEAPADVNLDFLRPDVLPPSETNPYARIR